MTLGVDVANAVLATANKAPLDQAVYLHDDTCGVGLNSLHPTAIGATTSASAETTIGGALLAAIRKRVARHSGEMASLVRIQWTTTFRRAQIIQARKVFFNLFFDKPGLAFQFLREHSIHLCSFGGNLPFQPNDVRDRTRQRGVRLLSQGSTISATACA